MIGLSNIYYRYPHTPEGWVLEGINLTVQDGEYLLIYGESGSGKSTLGYLFNGLVPHFFGGILRGSVSVNGVDTRQMRPSDFLSRVGLVLQNSDAQLFNGTVENEIAFGLESMGLSIRQIDEKIRWIAETLSIGDLLDRSPMTLSGGEKRLVAIGSVLCMNPSLLLLDEPFAHLDWEGAGRLRKALSEIHKRHGTTKFNSTVKNFVRDYGLPDDWETLFLLLDYRDVDTVKEVLHKLIELYPDKGLTEMQGFRAKLDIMAMTATNDKLKEAFREALIEL